MNIESRLAEIEAKLDAIYDHYSTIARAVEEYGPEVMAVVKSVSDSPMLRMLTGGRS